MRKKFFFIHVLAVLLMFGLMTNSWAYLYTYTDNGNYAPSFGGDNPTTYTLELTPTDTTTYDATFTIENNPISTFSPTSDYYGAWFNFKFSPSSTATITALSDPNWDVGSTSTQVLWGGGSTQPYLQSNQAGFHLDDVTPPTLNPYGGVRLTNPSGGTTVFSFDLAVTNLFSPDIGIPFQAGFYDDTNGSGNIIFNQLSESAVTPEPSTLLLLGSGLLGLVGFRRKFKKS